MNRTVEHSPPQLDRSAHSEIKRLTCKRHRTRLVYSNAPLWRNALKTNLHAGNEVDLQNIEYTVEGVFCELLAFSHGMTFTLEVKRSAGSFRQRTETEPVSGSLASNISTRTDAPASKQLSPHNPR
jgi:hypothetical protein